METLAIALLIAVLSFLTVIVTYRVFIAVVGFFAEETHWTDRSPKTRFAIIIPAHNEELTVANAVSSLLMADYPARLRDIFVVADNCSDSTASIAHRCGAICLERNDPRKGKGYALQWALERIPRMSYDAFIFIDADSTVSPLFLSYMDHDIREGKKAIQAYDATQNPDESWMTRLSDLSDLVQFRYYFRGRSRLGLSCRLLGNGMCFSKEIIDRLGWNAFGITENWEYYMKVTLGGYIVHYNPRARFFSERAVDFRQGKTQRLRWMAGRAAVVREYVPALLMDGIKNRSLRKIDAAFDFLLPSQSMLLSMVFLAVFLQLWSRNDILLAWLLGIMLLEGGMCGVALAGSGRSSKSYISLFLIPIYIIWKLFLRALAIFAHHGKWVKTERRIIPEKREANTRAKRSGGASA